MEKDGKKWLKFRLVTLLFFFLVLFVALISRAMQLQVLSGKALKNLAQRQHTRTLNLPPERGIIYDRNGEKLAASISADSVFADPSRMANPEAVAGQIAPLLKLDKASVQKKFSQAKHFCWLARRITPDQAAAVEKMNVDGIYLLKEPKRFYPNGDMAASLIGFVGLEAKGLEGLEMKYDRYLQGTPEKLEWSRDAKGKRLYPRVEKASLAKDDSYHLVLTIDSRIQHLVETKLREAIQAKRAKGGLAVVMDPKTGEILALASEPTFNPNAMQAGVEGGKNRAIVDCFDPGSTFKPFLVAAALEEKVVNENTRFYCENGNFKVGDRVIHEANRHRYGHLPVRDIIKYSSNIGCVKVSERLGKEKFYQYIQRFGFGSRTGIELPGESPGLLRPVKKWTRVDAATVAFGQGVSVTAIQLVSALSAIANQGVLMKPYVMKGLLDRNGQLVQATAPTAVRQVISPETAKRMTAIMTGVVEESDGTGKNARLADVSVAGKTGTSQKFDFKRHVYSSERVRTSFMGFFPAEDPRVAMLITLDEPQIDKWGGVAAAPVFKHIGEQILTCIKTDIRRKPSPVPMEPERRGGDVGLKLVSTPAAEPPPITGPTGDADETVMPDFRGMTIRDALRKATARGVELRITGSGWAVNQNPSPGGPLKDNRICRVSFSAGD